MTMITMLSLIFPFFRLFLSRFSFSQECHLKKSTSIGGCHSLYISLFGITSTLRSYHLLHRFVFNQSILSTYSLKFQRNINLNCGSHHLCQDNKVILKFLSLKSFFYTDWARFSSCSSFIRLSCSVSQVRSK